MLSGNQLDDETAPNGDPIIYSYATSTDGGRRYDVQWDGVREHPREYFYDGIGRVRTVEVDRPRSGSVGSYDTHQITILYDHRSRPIYVTDLNVTQGKERREEYFWGLDDELLTRVVTTTTSRPSGSWASSRSTAPTLGGTRASVRRCSVRQARRLTA